jgi:hypothetical protein
MVDTTWTVHGADYDVVVDALLGEFAKRTRGEEVTLTLRLNRRGGNVSAAGGQYGAAAGFQWSSSNGALYSGGTSMAAALETRYDRLVAFHDFAGAADTYTSNQQVPAFQETVPSRAPVSSLLLGIEPSGDIEAPGFWAVVVGGGDQTRMIGNSATVELELFVLAEYEEYADRAAAKAAFEAPL